MAEEDEGSAAHTLHRQASLAASQGLLKLVIGRAQRGGRARTAYVGGP